MPRRFLSRKPRDEISWSSIPLVSFVRLDSSQDDRCSDRLVEALHRLSFTLTNVDKRAYRQARLIPIRARIRLQIRRGSRTDPIHASSDQRFVDRGLPPVAPIAIGTPVKAFGIGSTITSIQTKLANLVFIGL